MRINPFSEGYPSDFLGGIRQRMCGITGYIGPNPSAVSLVVDQLKRLEYRGYDSAGIAMVDNHCLKVVKTAGKIADLEKLLRGHSLQGTVAIGHTRWATHGAPTNQNAHPHTDCKGHFAVVHNGIIENFLTLREWLENRGHHFSSETDTEVLAHLIEEFYQGDLRQALKQALSQVIGSYALALISPLEPDRIWVARSQSPLVIGLAEKEKYIASDIPAIMAHTRSVLVLEDGDIAMVTPERVQVETQEGLVVNRHPLQVTWDLASAEKGGFDHFMLKEIYEQPKALQDTLRGRLLEEGTLSLPELDSLREVARQAHRLVIVACGTAYHAGCIGKYMIEPLLKIPVEVDLASEFRYRSPLVDPHTLVLVISQSGETADTLACLRLAQSLGAKVLGIVNVVGSTIAREADATLFTWAGPEICVASTKAYSTQVLALHLLTLWLAEVRGTSLPEEEIYKKTLRTLPDKVSEVLTLDRKVQELAGLLKSKEDFFFLGRGLDYAVALEGALKLKEITYLHAEAYAAGEMKHGPLALISPEVPVICLVSQPSLREKMISNIKEIKARGGFAIALVREEDQETPQAVDYTLPLPSVPELMTPIISVVPLQMLAYYIAKALGREIDQPRNLAKSVTVE